MSHAAHRQTMIGTGVDASRRHSACAATTAIDQRYTMDNGTSFANILQQSQFGLSRPRSTQYVHCSVPVTHATQANDGPDRSRRLCTAFRMSCNGLTWTTELLCSTVLPYSMEHPGLLPKMPFAHGRLEEKPSLGLGENSFIAFSGRVFTRSWRCQVRTSSVWQRMTNRMVRASPTTCSLCLPPQMR